MALDIVRGVLHMHDLGIVHQDIKSGNVMLSRDFAAKVGDVGLAAVFLHSDKARQSSSNPGTLEWCAPEVSASCPDRSGGLQRPAQRLVQRAGWPVWLLC